MSILPVAMLMIFVNVIVAQIAFQNIKDKTQLTEIKNMKKTFVAKEIEITRELIAESDGVHAIWQSQKYNGLNYEKIESKTLQSESDFVTNS